MFTFKLRRFGAGDSPRLADNSRRPPLRILLIGDILGAYIALRAVYHEESHQENTRDSCRLQACFRPARQKIHPD